MNGLKKMNLLLEERPMTVKQLSKELGKSRQSVSKMIKQSSKYGINIGEIIVGKSKVLYSPLKKYLLIKTDKSLHVCTGFILVRSTNILTGESSTGKDIGFSEVEKVI
jgi:hypothetical protein